MRQSTEVAPSNAEDHLQLANALERQGKLEEAAAAARQATELNPKWARPRMRLAQLLQRMGQQTEADAVLRQAIKAFPDTAMLYHELGYLLAHRGDLDGAVRAVSRAMELDPDEAAIQLRYSQLMARQGNVGVAIDAARRALMLKPQAPGWHEHLSMLLTRANRLDEAETAIRQAIEAFPDTASLYHRLNLLLGHRGEVEAAIDAGSKAVALEPMNATFRAQLGHVLARAERLSEADDALGEALALAPDGVGVRQALEQVRVRRAASLTGAPEPVSAIAATWDGKRATEMAAEGRYVELAAIVGDHFHTVCKFHIDILDDHDWFIPEWQILDSRESRLIIGRKLNNKRSDVMNPRIFDIMPLLAAYHRRGAEVCGTVKINLEDFGTVPGLAFCDYVPDRYLIPDPFFVGRRGYADMRQAFQTKPVAWDQRARIVFWRGSDFGGPADDWRKLPRVQLCEVAQRNEHLFDVGISQIRGRPSFSKQIRSSGVMRDIVHPHNLNHYRAHVDIDGRSNSWGGLL